MQTKHAFFGKVVKNRRGFGKKQRQIPLNAAAGCAFTHVFVNFGALRVALKLLAEIATKGADARLIQWELARGQQPNFWHGIQTALRIHIESADAFNFVIEQIDAIRQRAAHGE